MANRGIKNFIMDLCDKVSDFIAPSSCLFCFTKTIKNQGLCAECFMSIKHLSAPCCETCGFPFDIAYEEAVQCASCLTHHPPFDWGRSLWRYDDKTKPLLMRLKHKESLDISHALAPLFKKRIATIPFDIDCIIPIPLHPFRRLFRGHNQSAVLAYSVSKHLQLPAYYHVLKRTRHTPFQGFKSKKGRIKNVKGAFGITDPALIQHKNILIMDDVWTSGATLQEASKALRKGGASHIAVITLTRVIH
jgi:ComF family protein